MRHPAPWADLARAFEQRHGTAPTFFVRAPGRVNLIGEHTDYNDGLVLPAAIERYIRLAARPNAARTLQLYSVALDGHAVVSLDAVVQPAQPSWATYVQGVIRELARRGLRLVGFDAVIDSDLPIGAGLSSSAAFELAIALALENACGHRLPSRENALLCQAAEANFVGVPCGIMDQFASALGQKGKVLFLDCRSQETHHIPLPHDLVLAVCDTGVHRTLAASAYSLRRHECRTVVDLLRASGRPIHSLRDLSLADRALIEQLPTPLNRRARHVVTENARVLETTRLLTDGRVAGLGDVFSTSHRSLRDDYEVSCAELDAMVDVVLHAPGSIGARMTGAGFGGAVVALVERAAQAAFVAASTLQYRQRTGKLGTIFLTEAADGASVFDGTPPSS